MVFILYALILISLILYNGFFKLLDDADISTKKFALLFTGKIIAIPVFIWVYDKFYGGIAKFDSGKFYNDVLLISNLSKQDLNFFVRMLFGFQDESPGSYDMLYAFNNTLNWDNGTMKDYFYNDNRVLIRFHVVLNFIAFNTYAVHALFSCFMSFLGFNFIYKTFKEWFIGKEIYVMLTLCFFPALWFYTGGLQKEGITIFVLGAALYQMKQLNSGKAGIRGILWFLFLIFISMLLKPYLLLFAITCFGLFLMIVKSQKITNKILMFFSLMLLLFGLSNLSSLWLRKRSLPEAALQQQHRFVGVSKGGIFLSHDENFIRLENDSQLIKRVELRPGFYTISKNARYMYWKETAPNDTLYCDSNQDTLTKYELAYIIPPSHSNVTIYNANTLLMLANCYYYTLFYPTCFQAKNALQMLAAIENLFVLAALLVIIVGCFNKQKKHLVPLVFLSFALSICLLVGLTAPNSGAIFRYRSPGIIFLLLAALYYLNMPRRTAGAID